MKCEERRTKPWALVVDDDVDARMVMALCLQSHGCRTVSCANGLEAIKALIKALRDDDMPRVILLDLNMPVFNGWEFLELMDVAQPKIKSIPVVLVTGEKVHNNERYRVLRKPFGMEELISKVERVAER